jgi:hypothetical protein
MATRNNQTVAVRMLVEYTNVPAENQASCQALNKQKASATASYGECVAEALG